MASDKHLARLMQGTAAWNHWRRQEPLVCPDLESLSLTLAQKQWGETSGGPINLAQSLLRGADLRYATLNDADLSNAILVRADLAGARLRNANLRNANLAHARLDDADLAGAVFGGANLRGADLSGARNLSASQIAAAEGDARTVLPSSLVAPAAWRNGAVVDTPAPISTEAPRPSGEMRFPTATRSHMAPGPQADPLADRSRRTVRAPSRPQAGAMLERAKLAARALPRPQPPKLIAATALAAFLAVLGTLLALRSPEHGIKAAPLGAPPTAIVADTPAPEAEAAPLAPTPTTLTEAGATSAVEDVRGPETARIEAPFAGAVDANATEVVVRLANVAPVRDKSVSTPIDGGKARALVAAYPGRPLAAGNVDETMRRIDLPKPATLAKAPAPEPAAEAPQAPSSPTSVVDYLRAPHNSSEWIGTFIKDFYLSGAAIEEADLRRIYAHEVDYFGKRKTSLDQVTREKASYYRDWPDRHYELVPGSIVIEWKAPEIADVTFKYRYKVSSPGKKSGKGRGRAHLTLDLRGPSGLIIREDGEVTAHN
jgi:hypothetical protein